jgi:hypothetical protein
VVTPKDRWAKDAVTWSNFRGVKKDGAEIPMHMQWAARHPFQGGFSGKK